VTARLLPVGVFVCLFRETLEADPLYSDLWLEGEISDISRSSAGHTYFSLRDDDGTLKCVLFRNQALRQHQHPKLGDHVAVHGGLSIYPRSGSMQLVTNLIRPAGLGASMLELEYLRQRLELEGLFDPSRKRPLPEWPRAIGVVTSAHGVAWHDIQTVVSRRYPLATLVLSPATVQGLGAPESIVAAMAAVQEVNSVEVVILARGGGANDDLAAFNDERVVRAVFACRVPVIAGIGHATDRTLAEDVADAYAATPSAAAEICVPSVTELRDHVTSLHARLIWGFTAQRDAAVADAGSTTRRLIALSPRATVQISRSAFNRVSSELGRSVATPLALAGQRLATASGLLESLSPARVLGRGYAAVQDPAGLQALFSISQLNAGSLITVILNDGSLGATVDRVSARAEPVAAKS
jgi:exodeoxyribonuclease VII large subunit